MVTTVSIDLVALYAAREELCDVMGLTGSCWYDVAPHFTCGEADAVGHLLEALGLPEEAKAFMEGHIDGDEPEDAHYAEPV